MVSQNVVVGAGAAALGLLIGGLIGHLATPTSDTTDSVSEKLVRDGWKEDSHLNDKIISMVSRHNLKENLRELTKEPHLAGTPRDEVLAKMLQKRFKDAGFTTSELVPYNVLLSKPDPNNPNLVTITDSSGSIIFTSHYKEEALQEDDEDPNFVHAFNAFTPAGDVETNVGGGLVYANYGRLEDFDKLEELGINVTGTLVIARYGKIFRGNKLKHAEERGATGLILFSDPADVALEGVEPAEVYPGTFWLPGSGMQRGSTYVSNGDPLTPEWPSTEHAYRLDESEADLAKIPCQPIGYDDARELLKLMDSNIPTPEDWTGGLTELGYKLGPQFMPQYSGHKVKLSTHNSNSITKNYNVIATIKGSVEPDRYVLIGNHRDAWGYGASDPSSGTAQLLETARVFGELMKEGWRPRRTLVFCSWGAEEQGLIGSTEWVEEFAKKLADRSVLYVNTDTCVSGPILYAPGSPLAWGPINMITKMVPGVAGGATLYDEWAEYHRIKSNAAKPVMKTLGSGSDYAPFGFYLGIPAIDYWFRRDSNKYNISMYPSYHTGYETFYMVSTHTDPEFKIHQGCSRLALLTLRHFSDSAIIPYSLSELPKTAKESLENVKKKNNNGQTLLELYDKFPILEEEIDNFMDAVEIFTKKVENKRNNLEPLQLRALNDVLMKLEQIFILPKGLPGRTMIRHALFAPSQFDSYAAAGFPGISDLLYLMKGQVGDELKTTHKLLKRHISDLTMLFESASNSLKEFEFI